MRPASTAELADAVKSLAARAQKEGRPLKMRTAHDKFATMQSFPCVTQPADPAGTKADGNALRVGILMDKMTNVLTLDKATHQLKVQAQIPIKGLLEYATANGISPPRSALPWWQGLTLGGIYATQSHGTGLNMTSSLVSARGPGWAGGQSAGGVGATARRPLPRHLVGARWRAAGSRCLSPLCRPARPLPLRHPGLGPTPPQCDWIVDLTWVDATGAVHVSKKGSLEANAHCGGLGLLGSITEFTLQMTPLSTTLLSTWYLHEDTDLAADIDKMLAVGLRFLEIPESRARGFRKHAGGGEAGGLGGVGRRRPRIRRMEGCARSAGAGVWRLRGHACVHKALTLPNPGPTRAQITPHLVVMWRPDIGRYTGHMQRPAPEGATVIKDATSNVIPQFTEAQAAMLGPGLRNWQNDPFNRDILYWAGAFDTVSCTSALTNAVGAAWATKPGPLSPLGINTPVLEGVAYTNNIISTECGDRCAFTSKGMQAAALVSARGCIYAGKALPTRPGHRHFSAAQRPSLRSPSRARRAAEPRPCPPCPRAFQRLTPRLSPRLPSPGRRVCV